jgi:predicted MarR family transcription regulator
MPERRRVDRANKLPSKFVATSGDFDLSRAQRVLKRATLCFDSRERTTTDLLLLNSEVEYALECESEAGHRWSSWTNAVLETGEMNANGLS